MQCFVCHLTINRPPSQLTGEKNFCNHACYSKYKAQKWASKDNPRWNGGNDKLLCKVCSKPYERKKFGKKQNKYCSVSCANIGKDFKRAEKHWNWKGGNNTRYLKKNAPRPRPDKCEVCSDYGKKRNGIVLDHNHQTNKFRGWLCSNCNTALGLVKENPKILKALIKYLNENPL